MKCNAAACLSPALGTISQSNVNKRGFSTYSVPDSGVLWHENSETIKTVALLSKHSNQKRQNASVLMQLKTEVGTGSRSRRMKQEIHPAGWS